ncbi:MAG: hypothetical protein WAM05_01450, partial [Candidatus Binataceae bacterium]
MSATDIGFIVLACVFGGALLGMALHLILPEHHLSPDSKDVIKLGMALTSMMSALVLALLINSAKSSYDAQRNEVRQISANVILLDRVLAHYGPETKKAREMLANTVAEMISRIWPDSHSGGNELQPNMGAGEGFYDAIQELSPQNEVQRSLQAQALRMSIELGQTRWLLFEQAGSSIPMPFLVLMVFWVTVIFLSFGLFAPRNATVVATIFLCAFSVSGAIFLILELDRPFGGLIQISDAPLLNAVA